MGDQNHYNWQSICGPVPDGKTHGEWVMELMRRYLEGKARVAETLAIAAEQGINVDNHPVVVEARGTLWIAREALVAANVGLVIYHVDRIVYGRALRESRDDAIQVGLMALGCAVEKFDDRGSQFSTYASKCIITALKRWIHYENRVMHRNGQLDEDLCCDVRDDETDRWEAHELATECARAVLDNECELDERERDILIMRFGLGDGLNGAPMMLQELGDLHGITKERVRQVQNQALRKVAATIDGRRN